MLFRFNIGLKRGGGLGLRGVPIYYMPHWRATAVYEDCVEYRPSADTFLHLLGISALAGIVLAALFWSAGFPWSKPRPPKLDQQQREARDAAAGRELDQLKELTDNLARQLPPERLAEIERNRELRERELQEELERTRSTQSGLRIFGRFVHWTAFGALVAIAVLPLIGIPFQKVTLERSSDGGLVVRKSGLWPSTRRWPNGTFTDIRVAVEMERARSRRVSYAIGWRWMVKLYGPAPTPVARRPRGIDDPEIAFFIDYQKEQPAEGDAWPASVRKLVGHLRRLLEPEAS